MGEGRRLGKEEGVEVCVNLEKHLRAVRAVT